MHAVNTILLLQSIYTLSRGAPTAPCRFSRDVSCEELLSDERAVENFESAIFSWEGAGFHIPGVGYEPTTAFTFDGHPINQTDGTLAGSVHGFSAPSKESLHVGLLALAVDGNSGALSFCGGRDRALQLLQTKIETYEAFNGTYPGYGCHFPWVTVSSAGLQPTPDWSNPYRVPALDNGELVWAVLAAAVALRDARGQDGLAARYEAWFECMATSATTVFYAGNGTVAPVTRILNISAPLSRSNCEQLPGSLNDPYEGETMTVLLDLFGDLTPEERGQLWAAKQPQLRAINFSIPTGILTVQEGFWFSSHEQWKTMLLPYLGIEAVRAVFANCERARTWDAQLSGVPGLFASVSDVAAGTSIDLPDYISAAGVQALASQPVLRRDVVTPYAAFPLLLHNKSAGLCWYRNMLAAPRMQGPHGSTEATAVNGTLISPVMTWDSKITTVLALTGGVAELVQRGLNRTPWQNGTTALNRFVSIISEVYADAFPFVVGTDLEYALPEASIPNAAPDWEATCPGS